MKKGRVQGQRNLSPGGLSRRDFLRTTTGTTVAGAFDIRLSPGASPRAFPQEPAAISGATPQMMQYDVVVVGATSAGIGAALAAGRQGLKVAVIEETPTLGGLLSNGLSNTDLNSPGGSSGIFEEFRLRSQKYYQQNFPDDPVMKTVPYARTGFRYEPHVADMIFKQMVAEVPSIEVFYRRCVVKVLKSHSKVAAVVTQDLHEADEITFLAHITIDATHEGDLLPLAGAKFRAGREPRSVEEPHAGQIYMTWMGEMFGSGEGDDKLQAFAMLMTIKDYGPHADKTIPKPAGYDPINYCPERIEDTFWHGGGPLPNAKYEVNEMLDGTDLAEVNQGWLTANRAERRKIWEKYRDYTLGYLYFRQTVMGERNLGLCDDEFPDNEHLPYILYVREGRRLEGIYVFNERDAIRVPGFLRPPLQKDSIGVGDWDIDSHPVARDTEGYCYLNSTADKFRVSAPYQAPYGILVPKDVDGLLVPMAVSATHIGFQVLRLEAIRMGMGQAAGNAAALCLKQNVQPRDLHVEELQEMLLEQGCALFYYKDLNSAHPHFKAIQHLSQAGVVHGYDDFNFRPDQNATRAELAKMLFRGLGLKVKMDYSDLWKIMPWCKNSQHSTPYHWATYYLMTLHNMGAFSADVLGKMDPDSPATRAEAVRWAATALAESPEARQLLSEESKKEDGPLPRGELAELLVKLAGSGLAKLT
jgi:hypothetical protein